MKLYVPRIERLEIIIIIIYSLSLKKKSSDSQYFFMIKKATWTENRDLIDSFDWVKF